jgi:hypothetical protein
MNTPAYATSLTAANAVFHASYGAERAKAELQAPLIIVLAGEVVLHKNGQRDAFPFACPCFDAAKAVAHVVVALYVMAARSRQRTAHAEGLLRLEAIRKHVEDSLDSLQAEPAAIEDIHSELVVLLEASRAFAAHISTTDCAEAERNAFARDNGVRILQVTEAATLGLLGALHESVEKALANLTPEERSALEIVVVGDHQARARSLGMQYFRQRCAEPEGADDRVTYGENVTDEDEALALVGIRRLDRDIARAFFQDEKRLQRDVLGDATKRCLDRLQFGPIR